MKLRDAVTANQYRDAMRDAGLPDNEPKPDAGGRVPGDGISRAGAPDIVAPATDTDLHMARIMAESDVPLGGRPVLRLLARLEAAEREAAAGRELRRGLWDGDRPANIYRLVGLAREYDGTVAGLARPAVAS